MPLLLTQRLGDHRSLTTTLGYLRVFPSDLANAIFGLRFHLKAEHSGGKNKRVRRAAMWP